VFGLKHEQRADSRIRTAFKSGKRKERDNLEDLGVDKSVHIQVGEEKEETGESSGYANDTS
jgi:hypothetical protein